MIRLGAAVLSPTRVFCIGRNYAAHAQELGNPVPGSPVVFMKPVSSLVPDGTPLRLPREHGAVHHEAELVLVLGEGGRLAGVTLGLDLTLRELQEQLKADRHPWERAKAFDASAPIGTQAVPVAGLDLAALEFELLINDGRRQHGETAHLLFPVPRILAELSRSWALRAGDLIYTGTPAGVGPLLPGDIAVLRAPWCGEFRWTCV
jgi:2-keto-4-pentenoate hydratase/2-oxohepta-3-ene-1,7-dioic acid hydratase in catechol pathway